jgi:hypothetical protein
MSVSNEFAHLYFYLFEYCGVESILGPLLPGVIVMRMEKLVK